MCDLQGLFWKLLPVLSAFGVVIVGSWLTGRTTRRQWIADNQKEEYRKLLAGLNRLNMTVVKDQVDGPVNQEELKQGLEEITVAVNTSLFINDFLKKSQIMSDILLAARRLKEEDGFEAYQNAYWNAVNQIIEAATKIPI